MAGTLNFSKLFSYREQLSRSSVWGHHFLFLNLILSSVIGFVYFYAAPDTGSFLGFFYLLCSWLGQMCFLTFVVYLLLLFPLSFIGSYRAYRPLCVVIAVLGDAVLLFDVKLYLAAKVHISAPVFSLMFKDLDFYTGLNYNFMYIAIPVVIALQLLFAMLSTRELYKTRRNYFPAVFGTLALLAFVASHSLSAWADASGYRQITAARNVYPAHYPLTARSFLQSHGWASDGGRADQSDHSYTYPLSEITVGEITPRSVVFIFFDGLSYADLSTANTPELMRLKADYMSFENHYLPYDDENDNFFAATFGLPAQYREPLLERRTYPVTLEQMYRSEYSVKAFSDESEIDSARSGLHRSVRSVNYTQASSDEEVFEKAAAALTQESAQPRSFAASLLLNGLGQEMPDKKRAQRLRALDRALGDFIGALKDSGVLDKTWVFITSSEGSPSLLSEGSVFSRDCSHVPLIVIRPDGQSRGVSVSSITSHFDLAPSVGAEILGITTPASEYSLGEDIFANLRDREFIATVHKNDLILIGQRSVSIYKKNGNAYIESDGTQKPISPNLEQLIEALRQLNRFTN